MGIKQLLLIMLGAIVVGLGAYAGVRYFDEKRTENLRGALQVEIAPLVQEAVRYFSSPGNQGGGSNSFLGFKGTSGARIKSRGKRSRPVIGTLLLVTDNGSFSLISVAEDSVVLEGVGDPPGDDGRNPIRIRAVVLSTRTYQIIVN